MEYADLFKALIGLGPGGIMALYAVYQQRQADARWRIADDERKALQQQSIQLLKDKIESDNELANAIEKLTLQVGAKP